MTNKEKIIALRKANPKLTLEQACLLLGIDLNEAQRESDDLNDFFQGLVGKSTDR